MKAFVLAVVCLGLITAAAPILLEDIFGDSSAAVTASDSVRLPED
ncbi:hypothetical protein SAMN04488012_105139 [Palleronia salina]|uniref:Uncharacterized protein n=2 Tax=Palleronia TaxID=315422 RepID=A0A1M6GYJ7_9RHOB|nr:MULTISPECIES: hypothetical protein [Palleronia]SEN09555.1 hypothetical protein SAMN04488011_102437 [Palleronia pelagia]SHJ15002.1 hypothetical protein SAMN04488012_105139 [Palleronia salina]